MFIIQSCNVSGPTIIKKFWEWFSSSYSTNYPIRILDLLDTVFWLVIFVLSTRAKFMLEHFMIVSSGLNTILCYYLDIWGWFCCASCTQWKYSWFAYVYSLVMGNRSYNGCICGRGCVRWVYNIMRALETLLTEVN